MVGKVELQYLCFSWQNNWSIQNAKQSMWSSSCSRYHKTISEVSKNLSESLDVDCKLEFSTKQCITFKDHKDTFKRDAKWVLISLSKGEIGIVSKKYL